MHSIGQTELSGYADLFLKNNINGKRLFLLTGDDLLQIGVLSVGHRRELLVQLSIIAQGLYCVTHFRTR